MNVVLTPKLERFVAKKIEAGQYSDPSAVVNDALEVLWEQEAFDPQYEAYLRREVRRGLEELDRGERAPLDIEKIIAQERRRKAGEKGL
jgi:antitoxin ParD1/3/4